MSIKITSQGQVTLPKSVRDFLGTQLIQFEIIPDKKEVKILPVPDIAGSLNAFAKNKIKEKNFSQIRDEAWNEAISEKYNNSI